MAFGKIILVKKSEECIRKQAAVILKEQLSEHRLIFLAQLMNNERSVGFENPAPEYNSKQYGNDEAENKNHPDKDAYMNRERIK